MRVVGSAWCIYFAYQDQLASSAWKQDLHWLCWRSECLWEVWDFRWALWKSHTWISSKWWHLAPSGYLENPSPQTWIDYSFVKRSVITGFEKLSGRQEVAWGLYRKGFVYLGAERLSASAAGWIRFVSGVSAQTNICNKTFTSLY